MGRAPPRSSSSGKAERNWIDAPRCMNVSVRILKISEVEASEYAMATSNLVVVDIGASSVVSAPLQHEILGFFEAAHAAPQVEARLALALL